MFGEQTGLKGYHAGVVVALDVELLGQTQRVAVERHRVVEVGGLLDETQLPDPVSRCLTAHLNAPSPPRTEPTLVPSTIPPPVTAVLW